MKKFFFLSACLASLMFYSCNDDDETPDVEDQIMIVEKDGTSFTITDFNNTLLGEMQQDREGRRLDLRAEVDGGTFILSISNWDFQNPPEDGVVLKTYVTNEEDAFDPSPQTDCQFDPNFTYCDSGLATYLVSNTQTYISENIDTEGIGTITITANDPEAQIVSGSFDVKVKTFFDPEVISFTGTFENLKYIVQ